MNGTNRLCRKENRFLLAKAAWSRLVAARNSFLWEKHQESFSILPISNLFIII